MKAITISIGLILFLGIFSVYAQDNNIDGFNWPERPNGKQFRIWIKPIEVEINNGPGSFVEKRALVIWQTGKALPNCFDGGLITSFAYDTRDGRSSHYVNSAGYVRPNSFISGNIPCYMDESEAPVLVQEEVGGNPYTVKMGQVIQALQPVIKYPAENRGKPTIRWNFSKPINIDGVSFGDETLCFGPAPCPTNIPDFEELEPQV